MITPPRKEHPSSSVFNQFVENLLCVLISTERQALIEYYRAKKELKASLEAEYDEDDEDAITCGYVVLQVRNIDPVTLKGTEWEVYQEFVIPPDEDDEDEENLDEINEDSVDDDDDE